MTRHIKPWRSDQHLPDRPLTKKPAETMNGFRKVLQWWVAPAGPDAVMSELAGVPEEPLKSTPSRAQHKLHQDLLRGPRGW